jgi:hypothetical protein
VVRAIEQSDKDDDLDEVELDEDPSEARNQDVALLPATDITTYAQENLRYFSRKKYVRNDKFSLCRLLLDTLVAVRSIKSVYSWYASD